MASSQKTRIGDITPVHNGDRKFGSATTYHHVRVQFPGNIERHLLLTDNEVTIALRRAEKNKEDLLKPSSLQNALD